MINIEKLTSPSSRRQCAADGAGGDDASPGGSFEGIPEVLAPPVLARNAVMIGRAKGQGEDDVVMGEDGGEEGGAEGVDREGREVGVVKAGEEGEVTKKRKRNKPTLSCGECVERKTKVCSIIITIGHCLSISICTLPTVRTRVF